MAALDPIKGVLAGNKVFYFMSRSKRLRLNDGGYERRAGSSSHASRRRKRSVPGRLPARRVSGRRLRPKRGARRRANRKMIKNVVERTLACKDNVGVYTKEYTGEIEPITTAGRERVCFAATRLQGSAPGYDTFSMSFTPCITKRILNAASVLYSDVAKAVDIVAPTGTPFSHVGLKVDLLYGSYHLEIWNYTNIPYEMEFIEVTNKSTGDVRFLDVARELNASMNWKGGQPFMEYLTGNQVDKDSTLDFGMIKGLSSRYNVRNTGKKIIQPGGSLNYFYKEKRCLDFLKMQTTETAGSTADLGTFCKGEKQIMLRYQPVLHMVYGTTTPPDYVANHSSGPSVPTAGFLVKVKEVFKIVEPDETTDGNQGEHRILLNDYGDLAFANHKYVNTERLIQEVAVAV